MPRLWAAEGDAARRRGGCSPARRSKSGFRSVSTWVASQRSMRAWTRSRGPASMSSARDGRGRSAPSPSTSRAIGAPEAQGRLAERRSRRSAPATARAAIRRRAPLGRRAQRLAVGTVGVGIGCKSESRGSRHADLDQDVADDAISASSIAFSFSRRMRTLVRRSTKRPADAHAARPTDDPLSRGCVPANAPVAQPLRRLAAKVQVRIWAMRSTGWRCRPRHGRHRRPGGRTSRRR